MTKDTLPEPPCPEELELLELVVPPVPPVPSPPLPPLPPEPELLLDDELVEVVGAGSLLHPCANAMLAVKERMIAPCFIVTTSIYTSTRVRCSLQSGLD